MSKICSREDIAGMDEEEYFDLVSEAKSTLEGETLVEKSWSEFFVVGDTHGNLEAAKQPAERAVRKEIPIVYLGDYVDRGNKQLETLSQVVSLKIERPEKVILLRGNHESEQMNRRYGFYRQLKRNYSESLFREILDLYERFPAAAVLGEEYFAAHGGIPRNATSVSQIRDLDNGSESYNEIMWNDPSEKIDRFKHNFKRGGYQLYGEEAVKEFLEVNDLSMIIRAHQVQSRGYRYYFDKKLLSLFSVSNYRADNRGKYAHIKGRQIELIENP